MQSLLQYGLLFISMICCTSFASHSSTTSTTSTYKCMVQMVNYSGEGAYIVVSVVDADGKYLKTLRVLGDDADWYPDLPSWWDFYQTDKTPSIDGITGATVAGGERSIFVLEIEDDLVDSGNSLRFETAVEHQKYVEQDLQVPLTAASLKGKFDGTEYIRYIRLIPNS